MRCQCVRKRPWVVVDGANRVCDDVRDGLGVLFVVEQVGRDPSGSRDRESVEDDPLTLIKLPLMKSDVGPAGLSTRRKRELVPVCCKVAEAVYRRG